MPLDGVPKREFPVDFVPVPPPLSIANDVSRRFELGYDALNGTFRDAHTLSHFAHPCLGVLRKAQEYMGVVGQEGPRRL